MLERHFREADNVLRQGVQAYFGFNLATQRLINLDFGRRKDNMLMRFLL